MELSRSSFYYVPHPRLASLSEAAIVDQIRRIQQRFPRYGYRRLVVMFKRQGMLVNAKRLRRILKAYDLSPKPFSKTRVKTTDSSHGHPGFPNLLKGRTVDGLNQVWVTDVTYLRVGRRFAYLAMLLDVYSRRIIGWALSLSLRASLCEAALQEALLQRTPPPGCVHHSDHGVQYTSGIYVQTLLGAGFLLSMANKGCSWENGYAESFFKTLKYEEVLWQEYETMEEAVASVSHFIEAVYNQERLHSGLGYRPPNEFEQELTNEVFFANRPVIKLR